MAIAEQVELLRSGPARWNAWRRTHPDRVVDLTNARLGDLDLEGVDFRGAKLAGVRLRWAYLRKAQLSGADLTNADLRIADLSKANLRQADLTSAQLEGAYLREANLDSAALLRTRLIGVNFDRASLRGANLSHANLRNAVLVDTDLTNATLTGSRVYGASVWNACLDNAEQSDLVISQEKEGVITVDSLDVAQFLYLLLNNKKIREVIDTITSKVVLILGRFTPARKAILDALRDELRTLNYTPVLFDFERPASKNFIETVETLAGMSRLVIADLTDAKVVLQELQAVVHSFPALPIQPLLLKGSPLSEVALDFASPAFLKIHSYADRDGLIASLKGIITRAEGRGEAIRAHRKEMQHHIAELNADSSFIETQALTAEPSAAPDRRGM